MKIRRRDSSRIWEYREYQADREAQSGHENPRQDEGDGVIVPKYLDLIDFPQKSVFVDFSVSFIEDEYQEDQGQPEGGGFMKPKSGTTINLTETTVSVPM